MKSTHDNTAPARFPTLQGVLPITAAQIPAEVVAGITLAAIAIPEVMGYLSMRLESSDAIVGARGRVIESWLPGRKGTTAAGQNGSRAMPIKRASPKAESGNVLGQRRRQAKMLRAGL